MAIPWPRPPIRRNRRGGYTINLSEPERQLLAALPGQLVELLSAPDDPALRRLFPPAYQEPGDEEHQAEYQRLMQEDLIERHREALDTLARTAASTELSDGEMEAWLRSLNCLRLVIGTRLDVSEDDDPIDTSTPERQVYLVLGWLEECAVEAVAGNR
ncbi:MAG: DUF2017 family protein [Acidimicrobiaceae bacterium]|nr:DUF2017 family protein [Acidimicrobiaceae bacterium]